MTTDAISAPIQTLLDLFGTALADVRFADLDAQALARLAANVRAAADAVAAAQASLDLAREALQEEQQALLQQAQRALAYARVYAENDETLTARLEAVALPRAARRARGDGALVLTADAAPPSRPRGRPRKESTPEAMTVPEESTASA